VRGLLSIAWLALKSLKLCEIYLKFIENLLKNLVFDVYFIHLVKTVFSETFRSEILLKEDFDNFEGWMHVADLIIR
jgi:hypothetical protein